MSYRRCNGEGLGDSGTESSLQTDQHSLRRSAPCRRDSPGAPGARARVPSAHGEQCKQVKPGSVRRVQAVGNA